MKSQREILAENLEYLIKNRGIDQKILAEQIGVSDTTISNWVRGLKYPRIDKIQLIADYFGIKYTDLVTEREPMNLIKTSQKTVKIPILGKINHDNSVREDGGFYTGSPLEENYRTTLDEGLPFGKLFYLEVKDDSMAPTIPKGAMVLIREQQDVDNGEIAAVITNDNEEATLKRVKKQGKIIMLVPDNNKYEITVISNNDSAQIIGKAIKFEQDL